MYDKVRSTGNKSSAFITSAVWVKKAKLSERVGTKKAKLSIMPKAFEKGEVSSGKKRKKAKLSIMRSTCVAFA